MSNYSQSLPSELGLLPKTHWNWFRVQMADPWGWNWYTNGHIAMQDSPVKSFPTEPPPGMCERHKYIVNPHPGNQTLNDAVRRIEYRAPWVQLRITNRTERNGSPVKLITGIYKSGVVFFESEDSAFRTCLQRHYVGLVERKYQRVEWYAQGKKQALVAVKDDNVVAIVMPYHLNRTRW